jgi:hypothetical protein
VLRWGLTLIGVAAFVAVLSTAFWPNIDPGELRRLLLPGRNPGSVYWPITFLASVSALVLLAVRLFSSAGNDRFRLQVFVGGLALGLAPLFLEVIVEESWPGFKETVHRPAVEPWVGLLLFVPMAGVPLVVAYAVLYGRIVDMRVVLRTAAQYLLAKIVIVAATAVPFVALGMYLYQHRAESLVSLMTGPRPLALGLTVLAGGIALRLRRRWLLILDRRYFREAHNTEVVLERLMAGDWITQTAVSTAETLAKELESVFHATVDLFVIEAASGDLRDPRGRRPSLNLQGTLGTLLQASAQPMDVGRWKEGPLTRLPLRDRTWLDAEPYVLLVPLRASSPIPVGLLALGQKRSEQNYAETDRRALMAIARPVALALENNRLRNRPDSQSTAAAQCVVCARLNEAGATTCVCGGELIEAAAPYILRGVYRFERRLGAGGMGVVYLARDLSLDRPVAIKTLPHVASPDKTRLRDEAQAMASLVDANLAVIFGIESWRDVPFLVEEYLESGTLADRLGRGRLEIGEAVDLCVTLAGALGRLHDAGIIHCDLKPSNIGFARGGVPKLIDFGLARMLQSAAETVTLLDDLSPDQHESTIVTRHGLIGTPPYMSPEALEASIAQPSFDLWALSVILFEAIAGCRPFRGRDFPEVKAAILRGQVPDVRTFRPEAGDRLNAFLMQSLSRDPADRFRDARAWQRELSVLRMASR